MTNLKKEEEEEHKKLKSGRVGEGGGWGWR